MPSIKLRVCSDYDFDAIAQSKMLLFFSFNKEMNRFPLIQLFDDYDYDYISVFKNIA